MFLGIDAGTQSVKSLLYDAQRRQVVDVQNAALDFAALRNRAAQGGEPAHRSGKQEWFENVINQDL